MNLLFVHGSGGSAESFAYQLAAFGDARAVNLPGHPTGELIPSIAGYAAWLRRYIVEQHIPTPLVLAGHSLGGGIVLQYALDHPQDLKAIVLLGSGARLRVHPKYLEPLQAALANPTEYNAQSGGFEHINPELAAVMSRRRIENGPAAMLNDMRACDGFDVMSRLAELGLPTLAIVGDRDVMTPPKYSEFLAQKLPNCRLQTISDAGHMAYAEKPTLVNQAIREFITGLA